MTFATHRAANSESECQKPPLPQQIVQNEASVRDAPLSYVADPGVYTIILDNEKFRVTNPKLH